MNPESRLPQWLREATLRVSNGITDGAYEMLMVRDAFSYVCPESRMTVESIAERYAAVEYSGQLEQQLHSGSLGGMSRVAALTYVAGANRDFLRLVGHCDDCGSCAKVSEAWAAWSMWVDDNRNDLLDIVLQPYGLTVWAEVVERERRTHGMTMAEYLTA